MFLSHEAQDKPFKGFFVNIASSSFYLGLFLVINKSKILLIYKKNLRIWLIDTFFSRLANLLLVSFLSAKIPKNFCSISFNFSSNLASKLCNSSLSAFLRSWSRIFLILLLVSSLNLNYSFLSFSNSLSISLILFSSNLSSFFNISANESSSFFYNSLWSFFYWVRVFSTYSILFLNKRISFVETELFGYKI